MSVDRPDGQTGCQPPVVLTAKFYSEAAHIRHWIVFDYLVRRGTDNTTPSVIDENSLMK